MKKGSKVVDRVDTAEQYKEWMLLIAEAKKLGLTTDEIREFFRSCGKKSMKH